MVLRRCRRGLPLRATLIHAGQHQRIATNSACVSRGGVSLRARHFRRPGDPADDGDVAAARQTGDRRGFPESPRVGGSRGVLAPPVQAATG